MRPYLPIALSAWLVVGAGCSACRNCPLGLGSTTQEYEAIVQTQPVEQPSPATPATPVTEQRPVKTSQPTPVSEPPVLVPVNSTSNTSETAERAEVAQPTTGDFAHADDFSWVRGRVMRIHSGGGFWQVRYAGYDESDEYGGNFVLVGQLPKDVQENDLVHIKGRIDGYNSRMHGTEYRIREMSVVEKGKAPFSN